MNNNYIYRLCSMYTILLPTLLIICFFVAYGFSKYENWYVALIATFGTIIIFSALFFKTVTFYDDYVEIFHWRLFGRTKRIKYKNIDRVIFATGPRSPFELQITYNNKKGCKFTNHIVMNDFAKKKNVEIFRFLEQSGVKVIYKRDRFHEYYTAEEFEKDLM